MGLFLPLTVSLLFISSSLSNPIPLDRAAPWPPEDRGILEQNAPETTQLSVSDKLTCDNSGADRCLLFPIGCVPGVNCTDRLEIRRVESGSNTGNIIISLNLHVSRTAHMLVAVPMPDLSNPNSTFLVGCSIDDAVAVVAKPDVDGVTEQLRLDWLRLVAVRATSDDLECIVSAEPGFIDLPQGDIAVFAGDLEPEEEIGQSARISGSLDDGREEEGEGEKSRERVQVESSIHKISSPLILERSTQSLEHSESTEPILVSVEDQSEPILTSVEVQRPPTTQMPEKTTVAISSKANKLRLKMLHSSENSSNERAHRHSSAEITHSTHASVHDESTSTTTTTEKTTTTSTEAPTEAPEVEEVTESTTETPSTQTPEQSTTTTEAVKDEETSTTVHPPHHTTHHHEQHHKEQTHHSHERATVDKEHHSVRMEPVTTTTTERPKTFEDDKELPEEDKKILRELQAGHVKEERRDEEEEEEEDEETTHADGTGHHKHATVYELTREAAQDPIGRRPSEHSHSHHSHSHSHSHEHRADDEEEEEKKKEHTTKKPVHKHNEEEEEGEDEDEERRQRMGEKKHYRRSEEEDEEGEEEEDDSSSAFSLIVPMIIILAPVIFY